MDIERDKLLAELRTVEVGIASKPTVEQSDCFVFRKGEVMTYNDEVACRTKCSLDMTGAINAAKLLGMLTKWPEETITFKRTDGKLQFKGKGKRGYFKTEDKILLPIQDVETPKKWKVLPSGFFDAVNQVSGCTKHGGASPHLNCICFTPDWIEGCDGVQAGRVTISTPFEKLTLINNNAVKQIVGLGIADVGFTDNWVHFQNTERDLVVSCHTNPDDYPSDQITAIFQTKGKKATLPKGLKELVDRLNVFVDDTTQWLEVEVDPTFVKVTGKGAHGSQTERKKIKYKGDPIAFSINPQLLRELSDKHDICRITEKTIQVRKGNFQYVTSLFIPRNEKEEEKE